MKPKYCQHDKSQSIILCFLSSYQLKPTMTVQLNTHNLFPLSRLMPWETKPQVMTLSSANCGPIHPPSLWNIPIKFTTDENIYNNYCKLHKKEWLKSFYLDNYYNFYFFSVSLLDIGNLTQKKCSELRGLWAHCGKSDSTSAHNLLILRCSAAAGSGCPLPFLGHICLTTPRRQENKETSNEARGQYPFISWVRSELARNKQYSWEEFLFLSRRTTVIILCPLKSKHNG